MNDALLHEIARLAREGSRPDHQQALALADVDDTAALAAIAAGLRDVGFHNVVT